MHAAMITGGGEKKERERESGGDISTKACVSLKSHQISTSHRNICLHHTSGGKRETQQTDKSLSGSFSALLYNLRRRRGIMHFQ